MKYCEAFFHLAVASLSDSQKMVEICAPLMYDEFNTALEPSFASGRVDDRIQELVNHALYGRELPGWYKNAVGRAMSRIGGTDPFVKKEEEE